MLRVTAASASSAACCMPDVGGGKSRTAGVREDDANLRKRSTVHRRSGRVAPPRFALRDPLRLVCKACAKTGSALCMRSLQE